MADVGVGLIILVLRPVLKQMQTVEIRLGFILPGVEMVNPYNQQLLRAWRANMDIQVGSVYGAALYVTHYICKDESQILKQVIAEHLASLQQDATVKQRLRKIGNTLLSHRQLSQQEAAFLVAGLHLKGSSHATVFVTAIPKRQQT